MRFTADGPAIPDSLLEARDAGEVLFFCGAGVSLARAKLPDFLTLAREVAATLGTLRRGPAQRLLDAAKPNPDGSKALATVAMDRVFSLLQQEFEVAEVRRAVAQALVTAEDCDVSAHRILLDLSRVGGDAPRLVTTNFDLLFERADDSLASSAPPHLPDPSRVQEFGGVLHIHGAVTADHNGARHDEFVLSSAEFGQAYLSDGWATRYIQQLLKRFIVVFVGYAADDPPVQYLLEAMNRAASGTPRLYAFHSGTELDAHEQWAHRGVVPIPCASYDILWRTLEGWAARARDPDRWRQAIVEQAQQGPCTMSPHERGQVAHLARTVAGADHLARSEPALPAEWLFVFDRTLRYANPDRWRVPGQVIDPFDALGLDDDPTPDRKETQNPFVQRSVLTSAWDAFKASAADGVKAHPHLLAHLVGVQAIHASSLPARLTRLGGWLSRVAHQPAAAGWLASKGGALHPEVRGRIEWRLRQHRDVFSPSMQEAWQHLFAAKPQDTARAWGRSALDLGRWGWNARTVREAMAAYRPCLVVSQGSAVPWLTMTPELRSDSVLCAEVDYPRPHRAATLPLEHLALATRLLRDHLEWAIQLEHELQPNRVWFIDAIRPPEGGRFHEQGHRINGLMATMARLVTDLSAHDGPAAQREVAAWQSSPSLVFERLRLWAAGYRALMPSGEAAALVLGLTAERFWLSDPERDVLCAVRDRWAEWADDMRIAVERRLTEEVIPALRGVANEAAIVAYARLNRLQWLLAEDVPLSAETINRMAALRAECPGWTERDIVDTAQPRVRAARFLRDNDDASDLDVIALPEIVAQAEALDGYDREHRVYRSPFRGLAKHHPVRALRALGQSDAPAPVLAKAWSIYLNSQLQHPPRQRLMQHTACRLARLPVATMDAIAQPVADWLLAFGLSLQAEAPSVFDAIWIHLVDTIHAGEAEGPDLERNWMDEAINRPAGKITELLFQDPRLKHCVREGGLPEDWKARLAALLGLPAPHGFYALAVSALRFTWMAYIDEPWVQQHFMPWIDEQCAGGQAFWAGFLSSGATPPLPLFQQMKARMIALATDETGERVHPRILAGMLLVGWRGDAASANSAPVSDRDLREALAASDDELRRQALRQLGDWATEAPDEWAKYVLPFLTRVWPLQRMVRTPASAAALVDLAFAVPEAQFDAVIDAIAPRLVPLGPEAMINALDGDALKAFVATHPMAVLCLLAGVLGPDAQEWPHAALPLLEALAVDPALTAHPTLIPLLQQYRRVQALP